MDDLGVPLFKETLHIFFQKTLLWKQTWNPTYLWKRTFIFPHQRGPKKFLSRRGVAASCWGVDARLNFPRKKSPVPWIAEGVLLQWCNPLRNPTDQKGPRGIWNDVNMDVTAGVRNIPHEIIEVLINPIIFQFPTHHCIIHFYYW